MVLLEFDAGDPNFPSALSTAYKGVVDRYLDLKPSTSYQVIGANLGRYQGERIWTLKDDVGTVLTSFSSGSPANWQPGFVQYTFTT
mgnify:FL=1